MTGIGTLRSLRPLPRIRAPAATPTIHGIETLPMKTLMLLRHGKSPRPQGVTDHERPLKKKAAARIAELATDLRTRGEAPDRTLTSDALRAAQTADAFCNAAHCGEPLRVAALYGAAPEEILEAIRQQGNDAQRLLAVGHNPGMEDCCALLQPGCLPGGHLRTGALAIFSLDIDTWTAVAPGTGRLRQVIESH